MTKCWYCTNEAEYNIDYAADGFEVCPEHVLRAVKETWDDIRKDGVSSAEYVSVTPLDIAEHFAHSSAFIPGTA